MKREYSKDYKRGIETESKQCYTEFRRNHRYRTSDALNIVGL